MSLDYKNPNIKTHMFEGYFGLEKECLRVTPNGFLSHTEHPFADNPNIERDFCENQTEFITDVCNSTETVWQQLADLQKKAVKILLHLKTGKELLWPFSNPPYVLGENDIHIANYKGKLRGKELYREYLAEKYGKRKMLFSGIHFNFSFSETILEEGYRKSGFSTIKEYKDSIYLELAKKIIRYSWLIVYLTAASPVMDDSFFDEKDRENVLLKNLSSPRCSKIGYWNNFDPILEYDTIQNYVKSIESYVEQGQLKEATELYYPVRLKPKGENTLENLKNLGVNHIELRMLDLNPLQSVGIRKEDLKFLHLFILYLMSLEDRDFLHFEQIMAIKNEKNAAKYEEESILIEMDWKSSLPVKQAALHVLTSMEQFFESFGNQEALEIISFQKQKILYPEKRYAVQVKSQFQEDYVKRGIELAEKYAKEMDDAI